MSNRKVTDRDIKEIFLANGFKEKPQDDGSYNLNDYVFTAARALLEFAAQPSDGALTCCTPTAEEKALLAAGDYTPEELWGGSRPTCPKCIDGALTNEGAEPVAIIDHSRKIEQLRSAFEQRFKLDIWPVIDWLRNSGLYAAQNPKSMAPKFCTCPSGDGSLRWPCPVHPPEVKVVMSFDFEHPLSKQRLTVHLTKQDAYDGMEDYFYDKLGEQACQCESVGETNVVDCNCDEYVHDFELVADNACLDRVKELNS